MEPESTPLRGEKQVHFSSCWLANAGLPFIVFSVTNRNKILFGSGLFFLIALVMIWRFFLPHNEVIAQITPEPPASPTAATSPSIPSTEPSANLLLTPAQTQEFLKKNLQYSPWPPKNDSSTNPEEESKKKSSRPDNPSTSVYSRRPRLPAFWRLCYVSLIGATAPSSAKTDSGFNPDPGAMLKPVPPPFFSPVPGEPPPYGTETLPPDLRLPRENINNPHKTPSDFDVPDYQKKDGGPLPSFTKAFPDRWQVRAPQWEHYTDPTTETAYQNGDPGIWLPYEQSLLKGDLPILGQDVFFKMTAANEESLTARNIPTPSGVSAANPGSYEFYGQGDSILSQNNTLLTFDLFEGETSFRPPDWAIRIQPVINENIMKVSENGVLNPNPLGDKASEGNNSSQFSPLTPGQASGILQKILAPDPAEGNTSQFLVRSRNYVALQQASFEYHIADISNNYDFVSFQGGLQPFNSDFRGFIFNDTNLGYRFFGNGDDNRYQYNVAVFDEREKDTNSQLNTFDSRDQRIVVVNLFKQDFLQFLDDENLRTGYTIEGSFHFNDDEGSGSTIYDHNGNIVRPEPLGGPVTPHDVRAYYFGIAGDGHIGRWNLSHTFYEAVGHDDMNGLAGQPVNINAQQASIELSYDQDWIRYKASFFYSSGDKNPTNKTATGFDSIVDNPNFIGGPFSYYVHNGFNLGGTAINLKQEDSLIPNLRTSKTEGQSNFVNPGVLIYGLGTDIDVTPKLKLAFNANIISFQYAQPIEIALQTNDIHKLFGYDLSVGCFYRPLLTNNIVFSAGFGAFVPGQGYRDIYDTNRQPISGYDDGGYNANSSPPFLYSAVAGLTVVY